MSKQLQAFSRLDVKLFLFLIFNLLAVMAQVFLRNYFFPYFIFLFYILFYVLLWFNETVCTSFTTMQHGQTTRKWISPVHEIDRKSIFLGYGIVHLFNLVYIHAGTLCWELCKLPKCLQLLVGNLTTHHRKEKLAHKQEIFSSSLLLARFSVCFLYKFEKYANYPPYSQSFWRCRGVVKLN